MVNGQILLLGLIWISIAILSLFLHKRFLQTLIILAPFLFLSAFPPSLRLFIGSFATVALLIFANNFFWRPLYTTLFGFFAATILFLFQTKDWLTFIVLWELLNFLHYGWIALSTKQTKAALIYFFYSVMLFALLLIGFSYLYPQWRTLTWQPLTTPSFFQPLLLLLFATLFFRLLLFPFHFWLLTVYNTLPWSVLSIFLTLSKLPAIYLFYEWIRYFALPSSLIWKGLVLFVALSGMLGNLLALRSQAMKTVVFLTSVSQSAFMLIPILMFQDLGLSLWFWANDALALLLVIFFLYRVRRLSRWSIVVLTIAILSLIGLPPSWGFLLKLKVLLLFFESGLPFSFYSMVLMGSLIIGTLLSVVPYLRLWHFNYQRLSADGAKLPWWWTFVACVLIVMGLVPKIWS